MLIDLTMEVSEKTPVFPGDPKPEFHVIETIKQGGCNQRRFSINSHFSTHIDAPYHMLADGEKLNDFPIESFMGEAAIIDVRGVPEIRKQHVPNLGGKPIIFFHTGHSKHAFSEKYFQDNPVIGIAAAEELVRQKVRIVGLDSFTPDNTPYLVHKLLFKNDILIVENLVSLEKVGDVCNITIAPLNLTQADGAPCRVWAEV